MVTTWKYPTPDPRPPPRATDNGHSIAYYSLGFSISLLSLSHAICKHWHAVKNQCGVKCRGVNEELLSMPNLWHKEDLVRAEVVHWLIDSPGTGQVINKLKTSSKLRPFVISAYLALWTYLLISSPKECDSNPGRANSWAWVKVYALTYVLPKRKAQ